MPDLTSVINLNAKTMLLLQAIVVIGLPLLLWRTLQLGRIFPLAVIQIFTGILLGPSIFGAILPDVYGFLFRPQILSGVDTLANVALIMFVFMAGCEADRNVIRNSAAAVVRIGVTGVFTPWILGSIAAFGIASLWPTVGVLGPGQNPYVYAVAFGLAMSVTALPVLIILLRDLGFVSHPIGSIAVAIGGIDDLLLWLALPPLLAFSAGGDQFWAVILLSTSGGVATLLLVQFVFAPLLKRLDAAEVPERFVVSAIILVLFTSAMLTELTGLHAVLGAFIAGLLIPDRLRHLALDKFDLPVSLLLLPFFFLSTGLKTQFGADQAVQTAVITAIALVLCVGGKFLGVAVPAMLSGQGKGFSVTLAVLMQCKGLMEIVVVTVLYQKGVIGSATFSALVITALISTAITAPLARWCHKRFGDAALRPAEAGAPATVAPPVPVAAAVAPHAAPVFAFLDFAGPDSAPVAIAKSVVTVGRHSGNDVQVPDISVSRNHAVIRRADGQFQIENLTAVRSEPNPMRVNGVEREHATLQPGDLVTLGGVTFTFRPA